ncbi:MAG: HRDC domain-containing protein, partial [Promicromonosporaceae bacterium]|nr:HRDC domain-containing protein [Promicromonosporaceae bacterium]
MATASRFAAGTGPVAADTERASGFRYGQATYLIQLRRAGAGTALIDTKALPDLSVIQEAIGDTEFVIHAGSQDLPGLREHKLNPQRLFDTELASRLLGYPRVALEVMVAEFLGFQLAKEHSASDWAMRPLPSDWLRYAALDVELLVELREQLESKLDQAGKLEWAVQEFDYVLRQRPKPRRPEPWRRTSHACSLRSPRQLAIVRALWETREQIAQSRDLAPRRVLLDEAIIAAAQAMPRNIGQLVALREFSGPGARRRAATWQRAIDAALALPTNALPTVRGPGTDGPPQPRSWPVRRPEAAKRLARAKAELADIARRIEIPAENLLLPDSLRRIAWEPPREIAFDTMTTA